MLKLVEIMGSGMHVHPITILEKRGENLYHTVNAIIMLDLSDNTDNCLYIGRHY